jgi:peptidoglycan hydrolase-like protein with peptidoglycan-binding domain
MARPVLRLGAKGAEVKEAQEELIARGYSMAPFGADGIFGPLTLKRVKEYQFDRWCNSPVPPFSSQPVPNPPPPFPAVCQLLSLTWPLAVDGVIGFNTWSRLDPQEIQKGSKGPIVMLCQSLLNLAGASPPLALDGDFGPLTEQAVKDFQTGHSIAPVDGKVGDKTWPALHS